MAVAPQHAEFTWPADLSATVWRYVDLPKYLSMLESNALFFCRLDKLGDPFEGSRPRVNIEAEDPFLTQAQADSDLSEEQFATLLTQVAESRTYFALAMRKWCAANCWHLAKHESAAMWDIHIRAGAGVVIRSTFDRLKASLEGSETSVYLGEVTYIDYSKDAIPGRNVLAPVTYKRKRACPLVRH